MAWGEKPIELENSCSASYGVVGPFVTCSIHVVLNMKHSFVVHVQSDSF